MPRYEWRRRVRYCAAEPAWWTDTPRGCLPTLHPTRLDRLMQSLDLDATLLDRPIAVLSTGERQRLALVRALLDEPKVLLLDEPTGALDPQSSALIEELIRFQMLSGHSVVLVSHDRAQVERLAHARLLLVESGDARKRRRGARAMSYVPLTPLDIVLAAALLIANGAISWGFRLGLEKSIAIAAARMVVQLALIGVVLKFIFAQTSPAWTVAFALVMVVAAGVEVVSRQHRSFDGWRTFGLSTATLLFIGTVVTVLGVGVIITPDPWYAPRYVLPILGMVLGNTMTAVAPGARRPERSGQPRARCHRGAAGARRTALRGAERRRCAPRCAPA